MNGIRSDLDTTRHQLEAAIQVIFLSRFIIFFHDSEVFGPEDLKLEK